MEADDRWTKLAEKLIVLTREGKLVWEGPENGVVESSGRKFIQYFAHYQDKYFRARKQYGPFKTVSKATGSEIKRPGEDKFFVAILDEKKEDILYSIPEQEEFEKLYEAVVFQKAGIDKLLDDLLKDA